MEGLWGDDFVVIETPKETKKLLKKISEPKSLTAMPKKNSVASKKLSISERLELIKKLVFETLGKYEDATQVIQTRSELTSYIDKAIENGIIAIDTETNNSLDPITCKLMGPCIYTPGLNNVYIPLNHVDPNTNERLPQQLSEHDIAEEFSRLSNTKIIMHNGKFDYEVLKCTCGITLNIYWDTMICAKVLDENERSAGLKQQYIEKIDPSVEKYSIDQLFEDIEYAKVDPKVFALYAATDSYMTYKLYEWQNEQINLEENKSLLNIFHNVEMKLVPVIAEMEMAGMEVDQQYAALLSKKYHTLLDRVDDQIYDELANLKPQIDAWRLTEAANIKPAKKTGDGLGKSKSEQLEEPINLASPTQLAILFYDVLGAPIVDQKSPRGTGEAALKAIAEKLNLKICDLLLERREWVKLITTYVDVIPELAHRWPDGRVRTHFNQYGAATGRLSSSDPINFQNIPSHNKEIRMLFCAKPGYKIIGSDYSGQEPRLTAFYSQDENMIKAYSEGKDLYAVIASMSFDKPYEDCLEFYPEGTKIIYEGQEVICGKKTHQNKEGKERRTQAKSVLLGVLYGRGAASVGEQIHKTREEAQEIIDKFFKAFPKVHEWINNTISNAHKNGYVEDVAGRRRRLPDILLDKYEIKAESDNSYDFNLILGGNNVIKKPELPAIQKYRDQITKCRNRQDVEKLKADALKYKIHIHDNTGFIAQAERQAVNSRVQGGAATLTKTALIDIYHDQVLRDLGAYLINTVHDEILIEAPEANAEAAADRLTELMVVAARKLVTNVPMSCDPYIVSCWYLDEFTVLVQKEFKKLLEQNIDPMEAFEKMCQIRTESTRDQIYELVKGFLPKKPDDIDDTYKSL